MQQAFKLFGIFALICAQLILLGCNQESQKKGRGGSSNSSSAAPCTNNAISTGECLVESAGVAVTSQLGTDVLVWTNPTATTSITAAIPRGYYNGKNVTFTDSDLLAANIVSGVEIFGITGTASGATGACSTNGLQSSDCVVSNGDYYSSVAGANITSWTNTTADTIVEADITDGYYDSKQCLLTDTDLIAANIKSGTSIFGVTGTLTAAAAACTDNANNASACTTAANRYVTATAGANVTTWANGSATTTVSQSIPDGFYSSKSCQFTDADLVAGNIKSGVSLFGVTGTLTGAYSDCTDDALNNSQCSTQANRYVTATAGANITSWSNGSATTTVTGTIGDGFYSSKSCQFTDTDLIASNIRSGVSVFGVTGSLNPSGSFGDVMASTAFRYPGSITADRYAIPFTTTSTQMTLTDETTTYANTALPTTGGLNYRAVPDVEIDDTGFSGVYCRYAARPANDCGTTQATVALRIVHCAAQNPTTSTWDGATQCTGGEGVWKLVTRSGANNEVWQDQRTKLLWSSAATGVAWCQATGNTQRSPLLFQKAYNGAWGTPMTGSGSIVVNDASRSSALIETVTISFTDATTFTVTSSGTNGCENGSVTGSLTTTAGSQATYSEANTCSFTITQGSTNFAAGDTFVLVSGSHTTSSCLAGGANQPASPISYCYEGAGLNAPADETWTSNGYHARKGGMGLQSTPSVRWRPPNAKDIMLAYVNGINMVLPDLGLSGGQRPAVDGSPGSPANGEWLANTDLNGAQSGLTWAPTHSNSALGMARMQKNASAGAGIRCVGRSP